jgi:hypothetical protein
MRAYPAPVGNLTLSQAGFCPPATSLKPRFLLTPFLIAAYPPGTRYFSPLSIIAIPLNLQKIILTTTVYARAYSNRYSSENDAVSNLDEMSMNSE